MTKDFSSKDFEVFFQQLKLKLNMFVSPCYFFCPIESILFLQGRISVGHHTLPYGLLIRFSTMNSTFTTQSPSKHLPQIDLMTLIYSLTYRNLRIQLHPIKAFQGEKEK